MPFPSGEKTHEGPKRSPFPLADVEAEQRDSGACPERSEGAGQNFEFTVLTATSERLDKFLADQLGISRTQAARLVADKRVTVHGKVARASRVLGRGETVRVQIPQNEAPRTIRPASIPLTFVFEDEHLAIIDKPAGLVVHPAPGHWDDTLVNALVARGTTLSGGAEGRPGIVHRLDRDTSGLMIVAKTDLAHRKLGAAISARRVQRSYAALAWGHLDTAELRIDAAVARHPRDRKRMTISSEGRAARTDATVVARFQVVDLLRLELHSGRTHQIRVHLEHVGHPVVGDPVYTGGGSRRISGTARKAAVLLEQATPRQALHAAALAFRHPVSGAPLEFRAEWPVDLRAALVIAGGEELVAEPEPLRYLRFFNRDG
ncbi:MAG TPA: RluA family pseudouridine synthase [Gemmatimonadales bacterium]|nr:RluA family pseudouridine synthase [Gemmatimonadales bacterium]